MYQVWLFSINVQGYIDNFISLKKKKRTSHMLTDFVYIKGL